jgi:hypothetical protein
MSAAATFYGAFVPFGQGRAWVGTVLMSFGGGQMQTATFVTRNNEVDAEALLAGRPFRGRETSTVTFPNGDSFDFVADFVGVPGATPALYHLHEAGHLTNGTGRFDGVSGQANMQGPFLSPRLVPDPAFIGRFEGSACGMS